MLLPYQVSFHVPDNHSLHNALSHCLAMGLGFSTFSATLYSSIYTNNNHQARRSNQSEAIPLWFNENEGAFETVNLSISLSPWSGFDTLHFMARHCFSIVVRACMKHWARNASTLKAHTTHMLDPARK